MINIDNRLKALPAVVNTALITIYSHRKTLIPIFYCYCFFPHMHTIFGSCSYTIIIILVCTPESRHLYKLYVYKLQNTSKTFVVNTCDKKWCRNASFNRDQSENTYSNLAVYISWRCKKNNETFLPLQKKV